MNEPARPDDRVGRGRGSALTVQGWQNLVLAVMGAVVLAGGVTGFVLRKRADAVSRELSDAIQPSCVSAYQVQAALRDQFMNAVRQIDEFFVQVVRLPNG